MNSWEFIKIFGIFILHIGSIGLLIYSFRVKAKHNGFSESYNYIKKSHIPNYTAALLVCFAFVGFVFGIHDDVISSFDDKHFVEYNWFNTYDIFKFPIDHYHMNKSSKNNLVSEIDFTELESSKNENSSFPELMVIDKTGSNAILGTTGTESLLSQLNIKCQDLQPNNHNDAILLFSLLNFYTLNKGKEYCSAIIYEGDTDHGKTANFKYPLGSKSWQKIIYENICDDMQKVCDDLDDSQNSNEVLTDFGSLLEMIGSMLDDTDVNTNKVKITMVSDFYHDDRTTSFIDLKLRLKDFHDTYNSRISQLNLIIFPLGEDQDFAKKTGNR